MRCYHSAFMSAHLPESVDAWRMVSARRSFAGSFPVARLARLRSQLAGDSGDVDYQLEFGRDDLGVAYLELQVRAVVDLLCQRTLEPFRTTLALDLRLGLIRDEVDEFALPPGYEALLVQDSLRLQDVVEDELLLALPLVPMRPGSEDAIAPWQNEALEPVATPPHPFAGLHKLKHD